MIKEETKLEKLFSPFRIKSMELKNRIVMPPMGTIFASADGGPSDKLIEYHEARARGGAAMLTVEVTEVHPYTHISIGDRGPAALFDDNLIPRWRQFTERIHAAGAKASIQLYHPGRQFPMLDPSKPPLAPSALPCPCPVCHDVPRPLTIAEIEELVQAWGQGARRAKEAGFDAVEVHGAHGYLIAQFMSAHSNRRTDRYGGDLRSRLRFPLEILRAVREKVGPDFPVIFRYSADERAPGGRTLDESVAIAPLLVEAGADCLSVSTGTYLTLMTYLIPATGVAQGLNVDAAAAIKGAVDVPVIVAGKLNDPVMAEQVLRDGKADLIAIGRGLLADPELPNKAAAGQFEDIRWCIACNECIYRILTAFGIVCTVNPELGREREMELKPAARAKRVLVAGGGPAGMEAAHIAAKRGHDVTLYEAEEHLGGQFRIASLPPWKQEISPYLKYLSRRLEGTGVKVVLGQPLTPSLVAEAKPDVVVVATGGKPLLPDIPGSNADNVVTAHDVLLGKAVTGQRVLVVGGGLVGCETADFLSLYGKEVTIVEMLPELASDMAMGPRDLLLERLRQSQVVALTSATIVEIIADGVVAEHEGHRDTIGGMDTIVLALGVTSVNELADAIKDKGPEVQVIGDAKTPGKALEAIAAGAEVGRNI